MMSVRHKLIKKVDPQRTIVFSKMATFLSREEQSRPWCCFILADKERKVNRVATKQHLYNVLNLEEITYLMYKITNFWQIFANTVT